PRAGQRWTNRPHAADLRRPDTNPQERRHGKLLRAAVSQYELSRKRLLSAPATGGLIAFTDEARVPADRRQRLRVCDAPAGPAGRRAADTGHLARARCA